jgi:type II secretory ATPase GspE/PulE/Tfp pilus assembly ATPase PilB-like protein
MPEKEKEKVDITNLKFYHGKGCKECSGLGYKGRVGIYEIFIMNKEIEDNILSGKVSEYVIKELAIIYTGNIFKSFHKQIHHKEFYFLYL